MLGPFTTTQAATDGLSEAALRSRAVRREHHGVYVDARLEPSVGLSVAAARLVLPKDAVLDGVSALHTLGVDVGDPRPLRFASAHRHQVRRPGIRERRVRRARRQQRLLRRRRGVLRRRRSRAGPGRVRRGRGLARTARAVDARPALRRGGCSPRARRGRRAPRRRARARAGGPVQETRLRLCLVLAGLPEPQVNPVVFCGGRAVGRVDLFRPQWRIAIEYEGDQHRTDPRQWNVDIRRQEQLTTDGCPVVRVTAQRMSHPRAVVHLVLAALRGAGWQGRDPVFDEEWHRLFPSAR